MYKVPSDSFVYLLYPSWIQSNGWIGILQTGRIASSILFWFHFQSSHYCIVMMKCSFLLSSLNSSFCSMGSPALHHYQSYGRLLSSRLGRLRPPILRTTGKTFWVFF